MKLYILLTKGANQSTNLKFHVSSRISEILSKSYKVSVKKVQKSYLKWHWRVMQSLKKNWLVVSNITWGTYYQPLKSLMKNSFRWALFLQSIQGFSYKNTQILSFMTLNSDAKFEENLTLHFQTWREELGELSLEHSKVWKKFTLMSSFCPKYIINVSAIKFHRNYLSWFWSMTQNLKEDWLLAWKMT